MSFIDWSDSQGMFDLFKEFIRDEINDSFTDPARQQFLSQLLTEVSSANEVTIPNAVKKLRAIQDSIQEEFKADSVYLHLIDLINELERII
jgi:hypothetical protein